LSIESTGTRDRFFDGRNAVRRAVQPQLIGRTLSINDPDGRAVARWDVGDMTVVDQNKANGSMVFTIASDPKPRLVLFDSPQRAALLAAAPRLRRWRRHRARHGFAVGLAWTAFGVALAALLYFGWRDGSAWVADTVPRKWEKNLGDRVRGAMRDGLYACDGKAGAAALESLGRKLLPDGIADLPLTIDVVRVKQVNAFALPGNHIFIFSGLIEKARNPDEVAGVLAHEMGHLGLRHPTRGMIQQMGLSAVISLMFGGNAAGDIAYIATTLSYTRDMEREADARAIALLRRAKIHTGGLASFFRALEDDKDGGSPLPDWLSTHPGLKERAETAEKAAAADDGVPALSDDEWRAVQRICTAP
jgi:Zn-dependent protease with chaperone function